MAEGQNVFPQNFEVVPTSVGTDTVLKSKLKSQELFVEEEWHSLSAYSSDGETSGSSSNKSSQSPSTPEPFIESRFSLDEELTRVTGKDVIDPMVFRSETALINAHVEMGLETGSFLVTNLARIVAQMNQWRHELPMVDPFYAVKCNPDPAIIRLLASMGCNFDCATMGEIDMVLNGLGDEWSFSKRGLASTSIVYANPAKMQDMLRYAMDNDVRMTVFDGEDELHKIAGLGGHGLSLLLRITTDDRASMCRFSKKFGCPVDDASHLLEVAKGLGLHVAGVSFHVGSGCGDSAAYTTALLHAKRVFDAAETLGMAPMTVVDLGGGFPGDTGGYGGPGMPTFQDLAAAIREGIKVFQAEIKASGRQASEIRFIAEPGRYFVSASTIVATKVYSRKGGMNNYQALYVDDGVYGTFNNVVYDHATPMPRKLKADGMGSRGAVEEEVVPTAVFGPTCDGLDQLCSLESTTLPRCHVDDWLVWENMGAYTHTASFVFNGYTHIPSKIYCNLA